MQQRSSSCYTLPAEILESYKIMALRLNHFATGTIKLLVSGSPLLFILVFPKTKNASSLCRAIE